jgi:hypothetical protein
MPEQLSPSETTAKRAAALRKTSRNYMRWRELALLGGAVLGFFVVARLIKRSAALLTPDRVIAIYLLYFLFVTFLVYFIEACRLSVHRRTIQTLADEQDIRYVDALVDALSLENEPCRLIASKGLIEMLPRLQTEDADKLDFRHRTTLNKVLSLPADRTRDKYGYGFFKPNPDTTQTDIRVSILKALGKIGDASSLPIVRQLAEGKSVTDSGKAIRQAARECLPLLEERVEKLKRGETLLRPATNDNSDPLLRPAHSSQEEDSELLLRPPGE